ncbi:MMPL family transporter [Dictyobacter vulcani]|nr:MMPL family transporter [Dictyobacter vulcani]
MPTQPPTTGKPPIGGQQPPTTGKPPTGQQPPTTGKPPIGGKPPVTGQQPPAFTPEQHTFIFLVALGADYTIFLMSRVREEVKRLGIEKGVPHAVARTGGVITSAGLILAGTFAVLTTLPLNILYQLGACVAVGILLDTFIVRGLLVPGLVLMLGKWNWWPGRL